MMSGVHGIDMGCLVIAADDGIMPQTIEHFNIFRLLDISKLIIVINKIDLVEDDILEIIDINDFRPGDKLKLKIWRFFKLLRIKT